MNISESIVNDYYELKNLSPIHAELCIELALRTEYTLGQCVNMKYEDVIRYLNKSK